MKKFVLVIDNYDSFTYNLVQQLKILNVNFEVYKNDEVNYDLIERLKPDKILISPGPGRPENSKGSLEIIEKFHKEVPILGVCLGHQAIGYSFGAKIIRAKNIIHGKISKIYHDGKSIFLNIPNPFEATRYHSLVLEKNSLASDFEISAISDDDEIMAIRHKNFPLEGVQFHPESIMTIWGLKLIENWLSRSH